MGRTTINTRYGLLDNPISKPISIVYEYILAYLAMDFVNNLLGFFTRYIIYNIYFGFVNIAINRVVVYTGGYTYTP